MKQPPPDSELGRLFAQFPRAGRVDWIGLRPARDVAMLPVEVAEATAGKGLSGDRYASGSGKRGITLIQAEHLPVIAALSGHALIAPATLRRNLLVSGIPLVAGCDLLEPYAYLGLGGALLLSGDEPPSPDTLGRGVDLLFEVADHG